MNKPLFIAEIGINYAFGDDKSKFLDNAKSMIDMVCLACDLARKKREEVVVKFQKRTPELCVPEHQKNKPKMVPWRKEETTYLQYKKDIEFEKEEYDEIDKYCKNKGIKWTASVWDEPSAKFLSKYDVPFVKLPSALITNYRLVSLCASLFSEVVFSTGMSTEKEINNCYDVLIEFGLPLSSITVLHCNSSYPAKDKELNLSYLKQLKENYKHSKVGYSGHEEGMSASIVAVSLGAEVLERHVTLSRSNWGTDQSASIVFDQLWRLMRDINKVGNWLGDGNKTVYESEKPIRAKLRG